MITRRYKNEYNTRSIILIFSIKFFNNCIFCRCFRTWLLRGGQVNVNRIIMDFNNSNCDYSTTIYGRRFIGEWVNLTQRQIDLLLESVAYHQLHLQKMYEQTTNEKILEQLLHEHLELCEITKMLIKELDKFE